ncbi:hypothetical protein [Winogradskyella alexanderae]|uniref:Lipoprotein n=1 Tax=Winogradskyella alexanderae TaxID=2877123 RepID=A0ABS7XP59_9FLAO|nr:hypothetical protein [Winogradskyella alexanderae]MCA0131794.1 hypothetical protein [Winogradskyella alexanderae]
MNNLWSAILIMAIFASCNTNEENNVESESKLTNTNEETINNTSEQNYVSIDNDEALMATALLAAPEANRANCKVIGYNMAGEFVTYREGTNEFIVLTDDPKKSGFNAACYHKSLEPFMARGRELKSEGKSGAEIFDIREEEVKSGKLSMGEPGATLHIYYGDSERYDPKTTQVENAIYRYVVYLPFATSESTGLPEAPIASNHPWIMNPGTHRAHIMISPINNSKKK